MKRRGYVLFAAAAAALAVPAPAQAAKAKLVEVGRFEQPLYVAGPPGDPTRVMVVSRTGLVSVVRDGRTLDAPFLDLRKQVNDAGYEQGMQSIAFAPDYAQSGRLYVFYTDASDALRIREFRRSAASADRADAGSARNVLRISHNRFKNHNGGTLQFGPDKLLYISTGDGGGVGNPLRSAQDRGSLLGKLLRIDPRPNGGRPYSIPKTNPFRTTPGARGEVYAFGLRNPFRFSFDRKTGDLVIGDVGQNKREEIDFVASGKGRGANFGWSCFEGTLRFSGCGAPGHVKPVLERRTGEGGNCSVIGGYVVRDPQLKALDGRYFYGDFCNDDLREARLRSGSVSGNRSLGLKVPSLAGFGEDAAGRIYLASLGGAVYRLAAP